MNFTGTKVSRLVVKGIKNLDYFELPANLRIDSIIAYNPALASGALTIGNYVAADPGEPEVRTLTLANTAATATQVSVVLNSATAVVIDLPAGYSTLDEIVAAVAGGTYPGWTAVAGTGDDADKVIFTATTNGPKAGTYSIAVVDEGNTDITGTFAQTHLGVADVAATTDASVVKSTNLPTSGEGLIELAVEVGKAASMKKRRLYVGSSVSNAAVWLSISVEQMF